MYQYRQGLSHTQGHKGIPEGLYEEEQGRKGFFGPVSHLLKPEPSTRWVAIDGPLRPHLYDAIALEKKIGSWQRLFFNSNVSIYNYWEQKTDPSNLSNLDGKRNADGDTLFFCHSGKGYFVTEYGLLEFYKGQYVNVPKCVTYSVVAEEETYFLVIESRTSFFREPDRGMLGRNGFYDPEAIVKPDLEKQSELKKKLNFTCLSVSVKKLDHITTFKYTNCYYDTVGWKGDFFPFTLHVSRLMPVVSSRVHLPPSVHTTFVADGFVVCTFLPRRIEEDADALKVPFYHQNIDYDEILFYHDGNFFSRDNLHSGMITLHPAGFPHGPHPKAVKNINSKSHTDEYAVMIDTWQSLQVEPLIETVEVKEYWNSWNK